MSDGGAGELTIGGGGFSYPSPDEDFPLSPISTKLDTTNYHIWHWDATIALQAAGKFGYVTGETKQPAAATDPTHADWARSNATVLLWLLNTLSEPILQLFTFHRPKTAAELWQELENSYGKPDPSRMVELKTQIFTIQQGNHLSVQAYHTKFETLWVEYSFYRPIPNCSDCNDCEAVKAMKRYREEERVVCFLNGLNESFSTVRSLLLAKDPLPSVLDAMRDARMIESLMAATRGRDDQISRGAGREMRLFCRYCKKQGDHVIENCLKLQNKRRN